MIERLSSRNPLFLEDSLPITDHQFGFRNGRSVMEQLILTYNDITDYVNEGYLVDLILFEFAKAFDTVNHNIQITKLQYLGISGKTIMATSLS